DTVITLLPTRRRGRRRARSHCARARGARPRRRRRRQRADRPRARPVGEDGPELRVADPGQAPGRRPDPGRPLRPPPRVLTPVGRSEGWGVVLGWAVAAGGVGVISF